jgi:class 3 adenylate cyclase/AmiR/NasT family two-component response regulator
MAKILIVDDQKPNLDAYKLALTDAQIEATIDTADNEEEAKSKIDSYSYDVVITDLVIKDEKSGIRILEWARNKDPLTIILIITAFEAKLERYNAYNLGAFDCIVKGTPGLKTGEELVVKTRTSLRFRDLALKQLENQKRIIFLKRYFDPKVFNYIENNPDLLNIKNKLVTVVFWDIRGFSKVCEILKVHPNLIALFLKDYFECASQVIFNNNGVLDKFIGDGVMAIFGALNGKDQSGREDAMQAANAALQLRNKFSEVLAKWLKQWNLYTAQVIDIGIGCGIHTGEALVGNLGTDFRDQYTAIGSEVNLAARIEGKTEKSQILISSTTYSRIKNDFKIVENKIVNDMKNIVGDFTLYELKGLPGDL